MDILIWLSQAPLTLIIGLIGLIGLTIVIAIYENIYKKLVWDYDTRIVIKSLQSKRFGLDRHLNSDTTFYPTKVEVVKRIWSDSDHSLGLFKIMVSWPEIYDQHYYRIKLVIVERCQLNPDIYRHKVIEEFEWENGGDQKLLKQDLQPIAIGKSKISTMPNRIKVTYDRVSRRNVEDQADLYIYARVNDETFLPSAKIVHAN